VSFGSPACQAKRRFDYVDKMMVETLAPIAFALLLFIIHWCHIIMMKKRVFNRPSESLEDDVVTADSANPVVRSASEADADSNGSLRRFERAREPKVDTIGNFKREMSSRYFSLYFFFLYLVLPSVTTRIFGMFPTINVDPDGVSGASLRFMRNDLSIAQDSQRYHYGTIWAAVFIVVYPIGVPLLYLYILYANKTAIRDMGKANNEQASSAQSRSYVSIAREAFRDKNTRQKSFLEKGRDRVKHYITPSSIFFLYGAYEGQFWYWEVVETLRRILLTAVISVVSPGSALVE
jgi:hypothetical protein